MTFRNCSGFGECDEPFDNSTAELSEDEMIRHTYTLIHKNGERTQEEDWYCPACWRARSIHYESWREQ